MPSLQRQGSRFIIAGIMAVSADFGAYFLLIDLLGHHFSKLLSFIFGSIIAFFINKLWTFRQANLSAPPATTSYHEALRFATLYLSTMGINVGVNALVIGLYPILAFKPSMIFFDFVIAINLWLAFFVATATSTILNFLGMKFWVFRT